MFPRFEVFSERVTIDQQTKLWALGQAMLEEDKKDEQEDNGRLNTLAFDVENLIQHHSAGGSKCHSCGNSTMEGPDYNQQPNMNRKDCIMEEIFTRTIRYCSYPIHCSPSGVIALTLVRLVPVAAKPDGYPYQS